MRVAAGGAGFAFGFTVGVVFGFRAFGVAFGMGAVVTHRAVYIPSSFDTMVQASYRQLAQRPADPASDATAQPGGAL